MQKLTEESLHALAEQEERFQKFVRSVTEGEKPLSGHVGREGDKILGDGITAYLDHCKANDVNITIAIFHVIERMTSVLETAVNGRNSVILLKSLAKEYAENWKESGLSCVDFAEDVIDGKKVLRVLVNTEGIDASALANLADSNSLQEAHIFVFLDQVFDNVKMYSTVETSAKMKVPIIFHVQRGVTLPPDLLNLAGPKHAVNYFETEMEGEKLKHALIPGYKVREKADA